MRRRSAAGGWKRRWRGELVKLKEQLVKILYKLYQLLLSCNPFCSSTSLYIDCLVL